MYIDAASSSEVWRDPAKAQGWVLAQLAVQGIRMRAA